MKNPKSEQAVLVALPRTCKAALIATTEPHLRNAINYVKEEQKVYLPLTPRNRRDVE